MWATRQIGCAAWQATPSQVEIDARGGAAGIVLTLAPGASAAGEALPLDQPWARVRLEPVGEDGLPEAADHFTRGDQWHVSSPQLRGSFSLDAVFRPVRWGAGWAALEVTLAIHTSLLDAHPMIDVVVDGPQVRLWLAGVEPVAAPRSSGCAAVTVSQPHDGTALPVAILLGPSDRAFTQDHSTDRELRLRLFGDFLEKGVIRKARPWIVLGNCRDEVLVELWKELGEAPLPLAT